LQGGLCSSWGDEGGDRSETLQNLSHLLARCGLGKGGINLQLLEKKPKGEGRVVPNPTGTKGVESDQRFVEPLDEFSGMAPLRSDLFLPDGHSISCDVEGFRFGQAEGGPLTRKDGNEVALPGNVRHFLEKIDAAQSQKPIPIPFPYDEKGGFFRPER